MRAEIAIDASRAGVRAKTGTEWYSVEVISALIELEERPRLTLYHRDVPSGLPKGRDLRQRIVRMPRLWTHVGLSAAMAMDRPRALYVPSHVIPTYHPPASVV